VGVGFGYAECLECLFGCLFAISRRLFVVFLSTHDAAHSRCGFCSCLLQQVFLWANVLFVFFVFHCVVVGVSLLNRDLAVQALYFPKRVASCVVNVCLRSEHGDRSSQSAREEGGLVQREQTTVGCNQVDCDGCNEEFVNNDLKLI
jgi:hypothetical protein